MNSTNSRMFMVPTRTYDTRHGCGNMPSVMVFTCPSETRSEYSADTKSHDTVVADCSLIWQQLLERWLKMEQQKWQNAIQADCRLHSQMRNAQTGFMETFDAVDSGWKAIYAEGNPLCWEWVQWHSMHEEEWIRIDGVSHNDSIEQVGIERATDLDRDALQTLMDVVRVCAACL